MKKILWRNEEIPSFLWRIKWVESLHM